MSAQGKSAWFDEASHTSLIAEKAKRAASFLDAMADGRIEQSEVKAQENRIVQLMQQIEPQLPSGLHEQITDLLCEMTVYDFMQVLRSVQEARPKTTFQG
jgi:hypothetical protein